MIRKRSIIFAAGISASALDIACGCCCKLIFLFCLVVMMLQSVEYYSVSRSFIDDFMFIDVAMCFFFIVITMLLLL